MEACVTAGMLTDDQALKLADAGLTAYNHNLIQVQNITKILLQQELIKID